MDLFNVSKQGISLFRQGANGMFDETVLLLFNPGSDTTIGGLYGGIGVYGKDSSYDLFISLYEKGSYEPIHQVLHIQNGTEVSRMPFPFFKESQTSPNELIITDVDGDGVEEFLTRTSEYLHLYSYGPTGKVTELAKSEYFGSISGITCADFNGDKVKDVLVSGVNYGNATIELCYGTKTGWMKPQEIVKLLPDPRPQLWTSYAIFGLPCDLDGDGDMDICNSYSKKVGSYSSEKYALEWYENNGTSTWQQHEISPLIEGRAFEKLLYSGDLDQNGMPDLLVSGVNGRGAYMQDTNGFGLRKSLLDVTGVSVDSESFVNDWDGDGDMDICTGKILYRNREIVVVPIKKIKSVKTQTSAILAKMVGENLGVSLPVGKYDIELSNVRGQIIRNVAVSSYSFSQQNLISLRGIGAGLVIMRVKKDGQAIHSQSFVTN